MYLRNLQLVNFKNYPEAAFEFSDKINCFSGNNGAGKTNLLDAIHYLSFCKSYFNPVDSQNIRHDEPFFVIHGTYLRNGDNSAAKVSCVQKRNQPKQFSFHGKEYDRLADHIGLLPVVMVSPYDRDLINDGSEIRRKYIDAVISQFDKLYLDDLINYNKTLYQRNALLKEFAERHYFDHVMLEVWNEPLVRFGHKIFKKRTHFIQSFIPVFDEYFGIISGANEHVNVKYESQLNFETMDKLLYDNLERDRVIRHTGAGIHKDDLMFEINGYPVKKFGSQGQQKSFVIAIKLAQFDYTRSIKGFKPILLLDDIFDKLDDSRVAHVVELVSHNSFGQVFITDTQYERINRLISQLTVSSRVWEISNGSADLLSKNNSQ
ncbi:MAG: DNA replication/repair protein RecF [Bacteroidales bacterium]|nr:DNA replication/repair protein RecF [Bacteroidales bacterium]